MKKKIVCISVNMDKKKKKVHTTERRIRGTDLQENTSRIYFKYISGWIVLILSCLAGLLAFVNVLEETDIICLWILNYFN